LKLNVFKATKPRKINRGEEMKMQKISGPKVRYKDNGNLLITNAYLSDLYGHVEIFKQKYGIEPNILFVPQTDFGINKTIYHMFDDAKVFGHIGDIEIFPGPWGYRLGFLEQQIKK
jgi:hypothetical protein